MYFIDELTGQEVSHPAPKRILSDRVNGLFVYGYTNPDSAVTVRVRTSDGMFYEALLKSKIMGKVIYSKRLGVYMFKEDLSEAELKEETTIKGKCNMEYNPYTFRKRYEAVESFQIFQGKQEIVNPNKVHPLSKYLKYTFGFEFEASGGFVPEHICFRDGLIPLRDGSIDGLEYSTVVLSGNDGLCLLDQQLKTLREYTEFDKECSLHMHFGGFPLDTTKIFNLYRLCKHLEEDINTLVPKLTFHSQQYKRSKKNYCGLLPPSCEINGRPYRTFEEMYESLVGRQYTGNLTQPHPNDEERGHKWNVLTRYYWVNFINLICYNVNKTVEFRMLRPTYNLEKITYWIYVFNAILSYAENVMVPGKPLGSVNLSSIFSAIYDKETVKSLEKETAKLKSLLDKQSKANDLIGANIKLENEMFNKELSF